jgi:hypothetical protein
MTIVAEMQKEELTSRLDDIISLLEAQKRSSAPSSGGITNEQYSMLYVLTGAYGDACIATKETVNSIQSRDAHKRLMDHIMSLVRR